MGKSIVSNWEKLEKILLEDIADCMNEVGQRGQKLMREHVEDDVYDKGTRLGRTHYYNGDAEPTGQLEGSVMHSGPRTKKNQVEVTIYHNIKKMSYDADTFLHGSRYYSPRDIRELLPYFINVGLTGPLFGPKWENLKRPYITNTRKELREDKKAREWMVESLRRKGYDAF